MRIRWRDLELPTKVVADSATRTDSYAKFTAEPFERGYGVTVGNGLRRVLLSSIEGTAVTSVKIQGVKHEFSSIDGIKEDVTDIILALKRLRVQFHTDDPKVLRIEKSGAGAVTGSDIQTGSDCEIVNGDLPICTITDDVTFEAEIEVRRGRGYVTAEENAREEQEIGVIPVDSIFSPIQRVRYRTENTRVGKLTNYDRLILELWTDGTITPEMALVEASKIYRKHLNPFIQFFDVGKELLFDKSPEPAIPGFGAPLGLGSSAAPAASSPMGGGSLGGSSMSTSPMSTPMGGSGAPLGGSSMGSASMDSASMDRASMDRASMDRASMDRGALGGPIGGGPAGGALGGADSDEVRRKMELPIAHLDLSVRASNCLEAEGVQTIGELVKLTQEQIMGFKNFGRTSLKEISRKLDEMDLSLGMDL